jgi:hypothetical protein
LRAHLGHDLADLARHVALLRRLRNRGQRDLGPML